MAEDAVILVGTERIPVPLATHLNRHAKAFLTAELGQAWIEGRSFTYKQLERHFTPSESATLRRLYVSEADWFQSYSWDQVGKIGPPDIVVPTPYGDYAICFKGAPNKALILHGIAATLGTCEDITFFDAVHFTRKISAILDEAIPSDKCTEEK